MLHVPYTYFPDASGGTEIYVQALAELLGARGYPSAVAAPAAASAEYVHDGIPVYRFEADHRPRLELAYGFPDEIAAAAFRAVVEHTRPRIVHLHARTSAVSGRLVDIAHDAGAAVVFTYHTPTASCARGTMMLYGEEPCDGRVEHRRCTTCALASLGLPQPLARLAAAAPGLVAAPAAAARIERAPLSALRIPSLITRGRRLFLDFIAKVDHVVAVCRWAREVLERNDVPAEKITLLRQGFAGDADPARPSRERRAGEPLRIAYFGRVDHAKGPDMLALALCRCLDADVAVDVYAIPPHGRQPELDLLQAHARRDARLRVLPPVPPSQVTRVMAGYDLIAIPSRLLETGPLVALEAFAAGVPVLGSNLGGIAELVRDRIDGVLVKAGDVNAWADAIARLAADRDGIAGLQANIAKPRTMNESAEHMAALYAGLNGSRR